MSRKLSGSLGDRIQESFSGMESGAMIGTVLSALVGAVGGFLLGGNSLLLGAAGALVTGFSLPLITPLISQIGAPASSNGGDTAAKSTGVARSRETPDGPPRAAKSDVIDVHESRLGSLSALLPRTKESGKSSRLAQRTDS
jgi:hypothetical protein